MLALTALAFVGYAAAQSTASAQDTAVVAANFKNAQLVPQLIPSFMPQGTLDVQFGGQSISIGQNLSASAVSSAPQISVLPTSDSTRINTNSMYTVMLVDANTVGEDQNTTAQTRHWLVNTVGLSGSAPYGINYTNSRAVTDYVGPGPLPGTGSHRYVVLLYAQSSAFSPPANLSTAGAGFGTFFLDQYVQSSGLGPLVAANYFQVQNGVATVTPVATSAVNTATVSALVSSMSSSMVASRSGSASSGASASGSSASAAATSKAAAGRKEDLNAGWGLIVGAVGMVGTLLGAGLGL